ncbi:LacI family transcriptional regulator [Catellatospora methionotrophica]|uniref:LacI family transcriptional regulator n=1 Tax=Catellatospora methionotrophica TaxID=121620 RepID=A0A8J3LPC1_9ACTN|nr:LacI family DNA-binding transcriptional regulator [Catellatospora methionotrophica]GIG19239.1 LacI family transcriptional regulator [Catellatospora methionotrophica]
MTYRKLTIEDIARKAGVSRATASRVLNNAPGVSADLRTAVNRVVADLGYRPNAAARALASGRRDALDLVVIACHDDISRFGAQPYYSRVIAGVLSALAGTDTQLRVNVAGAEDATELIDRVAKTVTAGAVLVNLSPEQAARFHARCRKAVSLGATAPHVPAVEPENSRAAYDAISLLHRIGCRRIAAIHGPDCNTCAAGRRAGHLEAVRELGLPDIAVDGGFRREGGYAAATRLLAEHPDLDGLFAACDMMAAGAIQAITDAGRRVPDDIAVVGFDDSAVAACVSPPLTTMRLPVEQMAAAATRALLEGAAAPHWRRFFPVDMVVRNSTGPSAALLLPAADSRLPATALAGRR